MGRFRDALARARPGWRSPGQAPLAVGQATCVGRGSGGIAAAVRARGRRRPVSILVDERFGGCWDDLGGAREPPRASPLSPGLLLGARRAARTASEAGADADPASPARPRRRRAAAVAGGRRRLGLDAFVEAHDVETSSSEPSRSAPTRSGSTPVTSRPSRSTGPVGRCPLNSHVGLEARVDGRCGRERHLDRATAWVARAARTRSSWTNAHACG